MKRTTMFGALVVCSGVVLTLFQFSGTVAAQNNGDNNGNDKPSHPVPAYNPYPSGILPADIDSEIARVRREIGFIFNQALAEWRALRS